MCPTDLHSWELTPEEAGKVQSELRERIVLTWDDRVINTVGGVDVAIQGKIARAALVILRYPELTPLESVTAEVPLVFPYIPGLLSFREGPAVLAVWEQVEVKPDLLMFDGQGIAHPRGMGLAAQMGLWLDTPSIGVAKSRLYGRHDLVGQERGDCAALYDIHQPDRILGMVLRSRLNTKPLYISPGHLIDIAHSVEFVLNCCRTYRLPEPTRWAHKVAAGEKLPSVSE